MSEASRTSLKLQGGVLNDKESIEFKKNTEIILKKSIMEQKNLDDSEIKTIHVLLAILLDPNNIVSKSFYSNN